MAKKESRVNFVIETDLLDQSKALAAAQGLSLSELICKLLQAHAQKNAGLLKEYYSLQKKFTV